MGERLTESDVSKIKEEIEYRKLVVRKKELEAVKEARAQGDLSENFEYKAAKQDKNRNESRIRYLERMLKHAQIVSDESKADEVGINNTVEVYFEEDDETEMRMVYDPSHPDADENGYVTYPNVNTVTEMTNLIDATRAYEANTTAFDATKSMVQAALNISK